MCKQHGIRFKKSLGQNLLLDDNINRIMVDAAAITKEDDVVEVGAGLGALTRRLASQTGRLLSVEIDRSFMPCLEEQFGEMEHVKLFRGDILNHSLAKLVEEYLPGATTLKLVANLPYYITTPVLFHFLESELHFTHLVVMVQEEVAQRLVAPVGSEQYSSLALAANCYANVDIVHKVPRTCFVPQPKVDSCIVRFRIPEKRSLKEGRFVMKVVRAAFLQRRKTLRNSLAKSPNFGVSGEIVLQAFEETGLDPGRRPQTLSLEEFRQLAQAIKSRIV